MQEIAYLPCKCFYIYAHVIFFYPNLGRKLLEIFIRYSVRDRIVFARCGASPGVLGAG